MTPRLDKLIVYTYVLPVITYDCPVCGYLAASHRKSLQSVLERGMKLACKVLACYLHVYFEEDWIFGSLMTS